MKTPSKIAEAIQRRKNRRGRRVLTPDGLGSVLCKEYRLNTNGGPGTLQYRVQLDDGRIRHYSSAKLIG